MLVPGNSCFIFWMEMARLAGHFHFFDKPVPALEIGHQFYHMGIQYYKEDLPCHNNGYGRKTNGNSG